MNDTISPPGSLTLADPVVSLQLLKNRLNGIQILEIKREAVLTPSARDYCVEQKIVIVRGQASSRSKSNEFEACNDAAMPPQPLLVSGTPAWMTAIAKRLCDKQAKVCETASDDTTVLRTLAEGLRFGHRAALAIVSHPHSFCWQAARDEQLRPAVVSSLPELDHVLREVPANVLILSSQNWNIPLACNSARRIVQHLQNQS